jgi:transposase
MLRVMKNLGIRSEEPPMKVLSRTDLTPANKVYLAAATVAMKGTDGAFSRLATEFGVTRPTLYTVGRETQQVLGEWFEPQRTESGCVWVRVDRRQVERATIALRMVGPNSVPMIHELLPTLYPGLEVSYGTLWGIGAEAEERAAKFNAKMPLSGIEAAAPDELFSQGQPVLGTVDLDSGVVAILKAGAGRSGEDWAEVFDAAKKQGFNPKKFVKDAALGIASGITKVFPDAEQRDDAFHAKYEIDKVLFRLERGAYAAIEQEWKAQRELAKLGKRGHEQLEATQQNLRLTREQCQKAVELFDSFEKPARKAHEALELANVHTRQMRGSLGMREELQEAASKMMAIEEPSCQKVGRYLHNRIEGLVLYAKEMHEALCQLEPWSISAIRWATVLWQSAELLHHGRQRWARQAQAEALSEAWAWLRARLSLERIASLLASVELLYTRRHRASSLIEAFNAALRPYLYVHKSVSQGFLELFRAYFNLRLARSGRHKGTSAYERLTGQRVEDWLSVLGYPPSNSPN